MNPTTLIIIDAVTVAILVISALRGKNRGLIKTLSGILVLILSFSIASFLASKTAPYISEKYVSPYITETIASDTENISLDEATRNPSVLSKIFTNLGISENIVSDALSDFTGAMTKSIIEPITAITNSIAYKLTYSILLLVYFLLSLLVLSLIFKLLNLASKIPGLNFANKFLGLILGLILGYLIVMAVSYIMLKFGIILTDNLISETHVLKFVMSFSILSVIANASFI